MELRKTLANGVEVVASTNDHLHSFCAAVRIRAGSAYEASRDRGITHMLEHCILRGLKGRFQEDYYALMSRGGIRFDAFTRPTNTEYIISGSPMGIPLAAEMLRKMFLPIVLSTKEFRLEKERILAELNEKEGGSFSDFVADRIWEGSPVNREVFGTPAGVKRFSRNRINAHMQSILVPGNVRLCLTGRIDAAALDLLLEAAEAIPMYPGPAAPKELPLPKNFGNRGVTCHCSAAVDYLRFAYDVDRRKCSRAATDLLREIMFSGLDALLYRHLSEDTGLVYGYTCPSRSFSNCATLEFCFTYDGARMIPTLQAVNRAQEQVMAGNFDLESKKRSIRAQWEMVLDDPSLLNQNMLNNLDLSDSPGPPDWEQVTAEEVAACARTVFSSGVMAIWHRADWEAVLAVLERMETAEPDQR